MREFCLRRIMAASAPGMLALAFAVGLSGKPRLQSADQSGAPLEQRLLSLTDTMIFQSPPLGSALSWIRCDSRGNIFVPLPQIRRDGIWANTSVIELLLDSKTTRQFGAIPLDRVKYPNAFLSYFDVDRDGTVYALFSTHPNDSKTGRVLRPVVLSYFIEHFKDDGMTDSVVGLDPPDDGVAMPHIYAMAVLAGGRFLLTGTTRTREGSDRPFTAMYDSNGRFLRDFELPGDVRDNGAAVASLSAAPSTGTASGGEKSAQSTSQPAAHSGTTNTEDSGPESPAAEDSISVGAAIMTGSVVTSADGYVYILRNSDPLTLYGVSPVGDETKHFQFTAPTSGLRPFTMEASDPGSLVFDFWPVGGFTGSRPQRLLGVFDTGSGQFSALYKLPASADNMLIPACSDRRGSFLYLGTSPDKQHLAVLRYTP